MCQVSQPSIDQRLKFRFADITFVNFTWVHSKDVKRSGILLYVQKEKKLFTQISYVLLLSFEVCNND